MTYFERVVHTFSQRICWVAILALIIMMLLTVLDVIMRYLGYPITGSFELVTFLSAIVIGFPIAYTQTQKGHIGIEFLVSRFPKRAQIIVNTVAHLLSLSVFSVLAWQLTLLGTKFWRIGQVSDTLEWPFFPFVWGVAFGCAMMAVVLSIDLVNSAARLVRK